jgi:hypothetical protein
MRAKFQLCLTLLAVSLSLSLVACEATDGTAGDGNADDTIGANLDGANGGDGITGDGPVIVACEVHTDCLVPEVVVAGSCSLGKCDMDAGVCVTVDMPDDAECTDVAGCWDSGLCQEGVCEGNIASDDGAPCHIDGICGGEGLCMEGECLADGSVSPCDDGNPCSVDICSEEVGGCAYQPEPDDLECATACVPEGVCMSGTCKGDVLAGCDDEPGCGDGACSPGETPKTCPEDCDNTPPPDPMDCIEEHCGEQLADCMAHEVCAEMMTCMEDCDEANEEACLHACVTKTNPEVQDLFWSVYACANASGCIEDQPDSCGNGQCEPGENPENCAKDCSDKPPGPGPCLEANCQDEVSVCLEDEGCTEIVACIGECASPECKSDCTMKASESGGEKFMAMVECGEDHGCFGGGPNPNPECGNGKCEQGETGMNCPEDCKPPGEPECGNGKCEPGENGFNCSEDCKPPGEPECGNGKCEPGENGFNCPEDCTPPDEPMCGDGKCGPQENAESCPKDCSDEPPPGDPVECLEQECTGSFYDCLGDDGCVGIISCMEQCQDEACQQGCFQNASQSALGKFISLVECGTDHGCFDGGGGDPPPDPVQQCIEEECGDEYGACLYDSECLEVLVCMEDCDGDEQCEGNCIWGGNDTFWNLAGCVEDEGCLQQGGGGDGGGGGGGQPECGDGVCEGFEQFFCPEDC